jgi:predicted transcriptional regulator
MIQRGPGAPYNSDRERKMEVYLGPETEAKLNQLAQRTNRGTDELLQEAVDHLVEYNEWLTQKVNSSIAASDSGRIVPDEEIRDWIGSRKNLTRRR